MFLLGASLVGAIYTAGFIAPNFTGWISYNLAAGLDNEFPRRPSDLIRSVLKLLGSRFYFQAPILTALTLMSFGGTAFRISTAGIKTAIRQASEIELTAGALLLGIDWLDRLSARKEIHPGAVSDGAALRRSA